MEDKDNFWGLPIGTEKSLDALLKDLWNPETEEIFPPKNFVGLGWGINFHAIASKLGLL
ncbi:MAG: hypothetical protein KDK36_01305 [Leptospiraceae bacterium]|nr:hypothetical protein [Leptospiraceae bacterium]